MEKIEFQKEIQLEFVERDKFERWQWKRFNIHQVDNYVESYAYGSDPLCETYYDNTFKPAYTVVTGGFQKLLVVLDNIQINVDKIYYTNLDSYPEDYKIGLRKKYLICYYKEHRLDLDFDPLF